MKELTRCVVTPKIKTEGFEALGSAVHRASTIVFKDAEAYLTRAQRGYDGYSYGLEGTPTTRTLAAKITALHQGAWTFLVPSGQAGNTVSLLTFLKAGDRVLIPDSTYPPVRAFAGADLARLGVDIAYYDPVDPQDLANRIDARTRFVWCESPGSTTMEIQDIPRLAEIAHGVGALVVCDNTWATPLNCKPLLLGADMVTEALTKYVSGHSDVIMGSLTVRDHAHVGPIRDFLNRMGIGVSPDDASLVLRGFETFGLRLRHAERSAAILIDILRAHPLVDRILYPSLPDFPGHDIWKRDFSGSSGVFGVVLRPGTDSHAKAALGVLETFVIGNSWGGTRSIAAPMMVRSNRTATGWEGDDLVLRISVGIEDIDDLKADIEAFLSDLTARAGQGRQRQIA